MWQELLHFCIIQIRCHCNSFTCPRLLPFSFYFPYIPHFPFPYGQVDRQASERASESVSQSVKQIWRIKKGIPVPVSNKRTLHFQFYFLHFHLFCSAVPSPTMCFPYVGSEPHVLFDILAEPGDTFHFLYFLHVDFLKVPTLEHGTKTKQTMKRGM